MIREAPHISKEAKDKATQATRRADDAQLCKLKAKDENRLLKDKVKRLESKLSKTWANAEAQLSVEKSKLRKS